MKVRLVPASAAVLWMLSTAAAQQGPTPGNPAGTPPGTRESAPGVPAAGQPNQADRTFLRAAGAGGMAEVELAKLAETRSNNAKVKAFAQRMVRDHGEANKRIAALAQSAAVPQKQGLDPEHKAMRERLLALKGSAFDRTYIEGRISDHQVMAQLLAYEIGSGQDPRLKAAASQLLPTVLEHLEMASDIANGLATGSVSASPSRK